MQRLSPPSRHSETRSGWGRASYLDRQRHTRHVRHFSGQLAFASAGAYNRRTLDWALERRASLHRELTGPVDEGDP